MALTVVWGASSTIRCGARRNTAICHPVKPPRIRRRCGSSAGLHCHPAACGTPGYLRCAPSRNRSICHPATRWHVVLCLIVGELFDGAAGCGHRVDIGVASLPSRQRRWSGCPATWFSWENLRSHRLANEAKEWRRRHPRPRPRFVTPPRLEVNAIRLPLGEYEGEPSQRVEERNRSGLAAVRRAQVEPVDIVIGRHGGIEQPVAFFARASGRWYWRRFLLMRRDSLPDARARDESKAHWQSSPATVQNGFLLSYRWSRVGTFGMLIVSQSPGRAGHSSILEIRQIEVRIISG